MSEKIKPIGSYVLVAPVIGDDQIDGGILIPNNAQTNSKTYKILELGTGGVDDNDNPIEFHVKIGDRILINEVNSTMSVKIGDDLCVMVRQENIVAIVEN